MNEKKLCSKELDNLIDKVRFEHIVKAIEIYNSDEMFRKECPKATDYEIEDDYGNRYPTKAILARAYTEATGKPCKSTELNGGHDKKLKDNSKPRRAVDILIPILDGTNFGIFSKIEKKYVFIDYKARLEKAGLHESNLSKGYNKESYAVHRVGQTEYRRILVNKYGKCCLCEVNQIDVLIASHIKPWGVSSSYEKVNEYNGLLLCPNHDKLFDVGLIAFQDNGTIKISKELSEDNIKKLEINENMKLQIDIPKQMIPFLQYHRENVFRK